MQIKKVDTFHKTRLGYLVFGLVELGLSFAVISWALDSGNLWGYAVAIVLLFGFLQNIGKLAISKWPKAKM